MVEGTRIGRIGLAGYPGYVFLQKIRYGYGQQRYDEKRTILHSWYSALRAYLPIIYHVDEENDLYKKKKEEYQEKIFPMLKDVAEEIRKARLKYKSTFENPDMYDPEEATFEEILEGIQERLDDLTAITGIIDKAKYDDNEEGMTAG